MIVLHLIDDTAPPEAVEMLALLVGRDKTAAHRVLVLGPQRTRQQLLAAGVPADVMSGAHSMGWADPAGWRSVRLAINQHKPTHLHAWGMRGAVAATVQKSFAGARIGTFGAPVARQRYRLLRALERQGPWTWTANSSSLRGALLENGVGAAEQGGRVVRVRPGIDLGVVRQPGRLEVRERLGIDANDGPVILLGGEGGQRSRHDWGLWAGGILQQIYPRAKVIVPAGQEGVEDFAAKLPERGMTIFAPPEMPWSERVQAADVMVVSADGPIATGSILWAMAASVLVIGTPQECVAELVEHGETGLLAAVGEQSVPRALAGRLEEFMGDSTLRWPLTDKARTEVFAHFKIQYMLDCFAAVYRQTQENPGTAKIELPQPEVTAADRFGLG